MKTYRISLLASILFVAGFSENILAQKLYTAEGYWIEFQNQIYQDILDKDKRNITLTVNESNFLLDYTAYLNQYLSRLSEDEKQKVAEILENWEFERNNPVREDPREDFDLRTRDRLVNGIYGAYYGASLVGIAEVESAGLGIGLPLIMAGAWQLGPVINKKKYEDITLATIRAGNTGKLLGLGYGASLGLALAGESDNNYKWVLGLSTIGSIAFGEIAFQTQKRKDLSLGYVEMVRLYGFLGPISTGLAGLAIDYSNAHLFGGSLVVGGIGGILIGNSVAKKYDYTQGDVDAISSLMLISGGLGATVAIGSIDSESNTGLLIIPAATAVAGTLFGQKSVRGIHLSKKQGSTIKLASGGAVLIGLGVIALTESDYPEWYVGTASVCGLVMHQLLFNSYKRKNLEKSYNFGKTKKRDLQFSMNVMPENYLVNKQLTAELLSKNPTLSYPIVNMKLKF